MDTTAEVDVYTFTLCHHFYLKVGSQPQETAQYSFFHDAVFYMFASQTQLHRNGYLKVSALALNRDSGSTTVTRKRKGGSRKAT